MAIKLLANDSAAPHRKHRLPWLHRGTDAAIVPAPTSSKRRPHLSSAKQQSCVDVEPHSPLDEEVDALKQRIRSKVHRKFHYFDFLLLQRVTDAPVPIPPSLAYHGARSTIVGGKMIPMTHAMWRLQRQQTVLRVPSKISE